MYVCRGENKKRLTRNPVCIRENLVRGVQSLPPQTKNPTYGPGRAPNRENNFFSFGIL